MVGGFGMTTALILVDVQNDFLPGGALAVPNGDEVIAVANKMITQFELVFATQDWHPADHGSFASQHANAVVGDMIDLNGLDQIVWPYRVIMIASLVPSGSSQDRYHAWSAQS